MPPESVVEDNLCFASLVIYQRRRSVGELIMLYLSEQLYYIIPTRVFSQQTNGDHFKKFLQNKVGEAYF